MGAEYFEHYVNEADGHAAFLRAQDEATYDHGHSGYTGTIAEKPGYELITKQVFTSVDEATAYVESQQENPLVDSKWGPAAAIRIIDDKRDGHLFFGWASS